MASQKSDQRREEIIHAAAVLFERDGYHNVTVEDIADAVGLSKATIYHYLASKAEILAWIHDALMTPMLAQLEADVAPGVDPRVGLRHVVVETLAMMHTHPGYLRVFFEHHREIPRDLREAATERRNRFENLVAGLIQRGIDEGMFEPMSPRLSALAMFGMVNWSYQWYRPKAGWDYEAIADHLIRVFLGGIQSPLGAATPVAEPAADTGPVPRKEAETTNVSDAVWAAVEPVLPTSANARGGQWRDHRQVLNAIAWKFSTGKPWRALPPSLGPWQTAYERLSRWRRDGTWDRIDEALRDLEGHEAELGWLTAACRASHV